jgi:tyramine---L-glutamate ligase
MRIFVSEYVCGGACAEAPVAGSLAIEGQAMLTAIVEDLAKIAGVRVTTTWDVRLGAPPFADAQTILIDTPADELPVFHELSRLCDATLVIAPETGGLLSARVRLVEQAGRRLLGPTGDAVELCTSKRRLSEFLRARGVPAIPTHDLIGADGKFAPQPSLGPNSFPIVIKPDDGAGSQETYRISDAGELARVAESRRGNWGTTAIVWQPWIRGRGVSVGALFQDDGLHFELFPPAEQTLSDDGRFRYLGGVVPARDVDHRSIERVAARACRAVPGLRGYVGIDLVVPDDAPESPVVVEINPRLTTSYCGYRMLTDQNLAGRMLLSVDAREPVDWHVGTIAFDSAGRRIPPPN